MTGSLKNTPRANAGRWSSFTDGLLKLPIQAEMNLPRS